mgnify:CR=1 FL=1
MVKNKKLVWVLGLFLAVTCFWWRMAPVSMAPGEATHAAPNVPSGIMHPTQLQVALNRAYAEATDPGVRARIRRDMERVRTKAQLGAATRENPGAFLEELAQVKKERDF